MRVRSILALVLSAPFLVGTCAHGAAGPESRGPSRDLPTLRAVLEKVGKNYVDPSRVDPPRMLRAAAEALDREVPEVRLESSPAGKELTLDVAGARQTFPLAGVRSLRDLEKSAVEMLRFVAAHRAPASKPVAEYVAANGILAALDPHSNLIDPDEAKEWAINLASRFFGIGIVFGSDRLGGGSVNSGVPVVTEVFKGGPAEGAGLSICDRIVAVENRWTAGLDWQDVVGLLRGPDGSPVWVTVERDGLPKDVVVTRAEIKVPTVTSRRLEGDVGLIRIQAFATGTAAQVRSAVAELRKAGATAFILDLRENFGGLLSQAIESASVFVRSGPLVTVVGETGRDRDVKVVRRKPADSVEDGPLAVLIGPATASSAEVLASALQNRNRAVVLGRTSWGKGSVQVLFDQPDGSKLKLTVAHYLTPGGASLQARGIAPDVELVPVPVPAPGRIRLGGADPARREAALDRAFAPREAARRSAVSLRYLAATPDGEEEVRIAHDLLATARPPGRGEALERGRTFLDGRRHSEEERVASALSSAGVDWSTGPAGKPALLNIRCAQRAAPKGDRVPFECEVRNEGPEDAFRILGRSRPHAFDLRDEEVVVGRVPAGESRKVAIEGRLAEDPSPRVSWVTFAFSDQSEGAARDVSLRIEAPPRAPKAPGAPPRGPEIRVEAGPSETTDEVRNVTASIRGPGVADAWVRVSNEGAKLDGKKVAYVARPAGAAGDAFEIAAEVPLKAGLNEIGVCSRAGDEKRCEKAFVYRLPGKTPEEGFLRR